MQKLLDLLARNGKNVEQLREQSRLLKALPRNTALSDMEFSHDQYLAFIEDVLDRFDLPGLGLRTGQQFKVTDFGILGYALLSSRTLGSAINLAVRYQGLWGGGGRLVVDSYVDGRFGVWEERSSLPPGRLKQFELEEATAQFLMAQDLLADPDSFRLSKVEFSFPAPACTQLYEEMFKCKVEFDAANTRILFPAKLLQSPLGAANELAQGICEEQCTRFLHILEDRGGLTERVRVIILNSPGELPSLQDVAKVFNMSLRTVRRRLKSENTTYKDILMDVRMQMAKQYLLETPLSIKEIGYLLCYSEVANFQRAFKNWYNATPREMRLNNTSTD